MAMIYRLLRAPFSACSHLLSQDRNYLLHEANHGARWFTWDITITFMALTGFPPLLMVLTASFHVDSEALVWYSTTCVFFIGTSAFAFIGPTKDKVRWHVVVAATRTLHSLLGYYLAVQFGLFGKNFTIFVTSLAFLVYTALFHFYGAIQRSRQLQANEPAALDVKTTGKSKHEVFGLHMKYLTTQQKEEERTIAIGTVNNKLHQSNELPTESAQARYKRAQSSRLTTSATQVHYWYHPTLHVAHHSFLPRPKVGRLRHWLNTLSRNPHHENVPDSEQPNSQDSNPALDIKAPLFSRCYCCLDTDPLPKKLTLPGSVPHKRDERKLQWKRIRDHFLEQSPNFHPDLSDHSANEIMDAFLSAGLPHHQLCERCAFFCSHSYLLDLAKGWNIQSVYAFLKDAFRTIPVVEESFELWSTALELKESAKNCHLCTLIWTSMNDEQQTSLLLDSEKLGIQLENAVIDAGDRQEELERIRHQIHEKRAVVVKIQSPSSQSRWAKAWESRQFGKQSLQLIPHFGKHVVAQRWLEARLADRAISSDRDPSLQWHREHVDPIEIHYMDLNNLGKIVPPVSGTTGSDTAIAFIKSWSRSHHHSIESLGRLPSRLLDVGETGTSTIRLVTSLEIYGQTPSSSRAPPGSRPRYLALSHCWGKSKRLVLNVANEKHLRTIITLEQLPPTFQDAVLMTRSLGLRYLWIDSLCIIQDSSQDWNRESSRMQDVYSNAEYVIAAAAAWDSKERFIVDQNCLALSPCLIGVGGKLEGKMGRDPSSNSRFGGIYALPPTKYTRAAAQDISLSKLHSRAWVFQEERLAKRMLYFGEHQIFLRCNICKYMTRQIQWCDKDENRKSKLPRFPRRGITNFFSENNYFPDLVRPKVWQVLLGLIVNSIMEYAEITIIFFIRCLTIKINVNWPNDNSAQNEGHAEGSIPLEQFERPTIVATVTSSIDPESHATSTTESGHLDESEPAEHLLTRKWWDAVGSYSSRFLTQRKDKLPAVAGIATLYHSVATKQDLNVHYLAGLWSTQEYLAMGLLWYVSAGRAPRPRFNDEQRTSPITLPSWSWASVDGRISNNSIAGTPSQEYSSIDILDVLATYDNPTMPGQRENFSLQNCTQGHLLIDGCVKKARWKRRAGQAKKFYVGHNEDGPAIIRNGSHLNAFVPLVDDSEAGPAAFDLLFADADGTQFGHFIPDTIDDHPQENDELFCLRIIFQPSGEEGKKDYNVPWATRGLVLLKTGRSYVRKSSAEAGKLLADFEVTAHEQQLDITQSVLEYRRIGYFELNKTLGALSFPHSFPLAGSFAFSTKGFYQRADRKRPEIDIMGFFRTCEKQRIIIT